MITMAKAMYDLYIKPRLGEKGQDMVEYALMLAIIVGIGWMIYKQTDLANQINNVFNNAGSLMDNAQKISGGTAAGGAAGGATGGK
ncbi:Flp family type IVb pilin [Acidaminococcus timonensis]|jgi:Flp pilus assembly pilin Flp|uniref:Flp family type IVb pilin n=1 Tax=Acidaminococcus timonensis TaxID=1871002 RepID=UPI003A5C28AF